MSSHGNLCYGGLLRGSGVPVKFVLVSVNTLPAGLVRGLYIATGQYSSLCVSAVVLTLGGDHIEDGVPDREQVDSEREKVKVRDKEKGRPTRRDNKRSYM